MVLLNWRPLSRANPCSRESRRAQQPSTNPSESAPVSRADRMHRAPRAMALGHPSRARWQAAAPAGGGIGFILEVGRATGLGLGVGRPRHFASLAKKSESASMGWSAIISSMNSSFATITCPPSPHPSPLPIHLGLRMSAFLCLSNPSFPVTVSPATVIN